MEQVKLVGVIVASGIILFFGYRTYAIWSWEAKYRPVVKEAEEVCEKLEQLTDSVPENYRRNGYLDKEEWAEGVLLEMKQLECLSKTSALSNLPPKPFYEESTGKMSLFP